MKILQELLDRLDYKKTTEAICRFISDQVAGNNAKGLIVGVSGGLDSAVVAFLGVKALGPKKVYGLFLPEKDTASDSRRHAEAVAVTAGFPLEIVDLTPTLERLGCYSNLIVKLARNSIINRIGFQVSRKMLNLDLYEFNLKEAENRIIRQAVESYYQRFRTRMSMLRERARDEGMLLPDSFNRTESLIGFSIRHGDIDGDFAPILPLYKSQVRVIANYLGVPQKIISRPPTPDLIPGITDEIFLDISYEQLDSILFSLEKGLSEREIYLQCGIPLKQVRRVKHLMALASQAGQQRGNIPYPDIVEIA